MQKLKTILLRCFLVVFSAGWVFPFWLAGAAYLNFVQIEAWPLWRGETPINSFPFLRFVSNALFIGCGWLMLALAFWTWIFSANVIAKDKA